MSNSTKPSPSLPPGDPPPAYSSAPTSTKGSTSNPYYIVSTRLDALMKHFWLYTTLSRTSSVSTRLRIYSDQLIILLRSLPSHDLRMLGEKYLLLTQKLFFFFDLLAVVAKFSSTNDSCCAYWTTYLSFWLLGELVRAKLFESKERVRPGRVLDTYLRFSYDGSRISRLKCGWWEKRKAVAKMGSAVSEMQNLALEAEFCTMRSEGECMCMLRNLHMMYGDRDLW